MKKPKILLTNDDGIEAPGLYHLWHALADIADISIVAPSHEQSGVGCKITLHDPLWPHPVRWEGGTPAWKLNGTPADCVRFATRLLLDSPPDLIVSGMNKGANSGKVMLHSGTVGAVITGALRGIPGIAFSCVDDGNPNYARAEPYIAPLVLHMLAHPMPRGNFLNVNIPDQAPVIHGYKLARQGLSYWVESLERREHPQGGVYYWQGGAWEDADDHEETDVALLRKGYVTAVPVHVEEITDLQFFQARKEHFEEQLNSPLEGAVHPE